MSKVFESLAVEEVVFSCCKAQTRNRCGTCLDCKGLLHLNSPHVGTYPDPDFSTWRKDGGFEYSYRTGL
jgi:hypothetical protein